MKQVAIFGACLALLFGCKDEEALVLVLPDYEYFPLETGRWIVYNVDSTVHLDIDDGTNQPDTSIVYYHYQVRESIDSSFTDGEGELAYRIVRETRENDTLPWTFQGIWTGKRNARSAQKVEDNIRFVKLSFPVSTRHTWNGNAYNTLPNEDYIFTEVHAPQSIGPYLFDSTVTVNQYEFISLINTIVRSEKYAMHVGLVFRQRDSLNINILGETVNGLELEQTIDSYGP